MRGSPCTRRKNRSNKKAVLLDSQPEEQVKAGPSFHQDRPEKNLFGFQPPTSPSFPNEPPSLVSIPFQPSVDPSISSAPTSFVFDTFPGPSSHLQSQHTPSTTERSVETSRLVYDEKEVDTNGNRFRSFLKTLVANHLQIYPIAQP